MNKKLILFILVGIVLIGGLFLSLKPKDGVEVVSERVSGKYFELVVKDGKVISGENTLMAKDGDMVTIKITVDKPEELHLHGYDKTIELAKDMATELSFLADLTGRFAIELHDAGIEIAVLEVNP